MNGQITRGLFIMAGLMALHSLTQAEVASLSWRPTSFAYILQAGLLDQERASCIQAIASSGRDVIILDRNYDGEEDGAWKKSELEQIRNARSGRKILCYISVGEAEDYRLYWKKQWDSDRNGVPDQEAPSFLLRENPKWKGNYRVKFWQKDWQSTIYNDIRTIMNQGFDGLYLDIVDAFEYFENDHGKYKDHKINLETNRSYREDMIAFVASISDEIKSRFGSDKLLVPQNGSQLLESEIFRQATDAIALEDLFSEDNRVQNKKHTEEIMANLKHLSNSAKPVFIVEYAQKEAQRDSIKKMKPNNFIGLFTNRDLSQVGEAF